MVVSLTKGGIIYSILHTIAEMYKKQNKHYFVLGLP